MVTRPRTIAFVALAALAAGAGAVRAQTVVQRPADGFSILVPSGWAEKSDSDSAIAIAQRTQPSVQTMVFVQKEAAPAAITDVLARAAVKLKNDKTRTLVSSKFDVVLDRPALVAVLEDKTARYKLVLIPRDEDETSQIFYGIMSAAPAALFAKSEPAFDRVVGGFQIVPMAAAAAQPKPSGSRPVPAAPTGATAARPSTTGIDRAGVLERILAPHPRTPR